MIEDTTGTNLILKVVQVPRKKGVANKFVKFQSEGLERLPLAERAHIANMAPKYNANCEFFFNNQQKDKRHLCNIRRDKDRIALVKTSAAANSLWSNASYSLVSIRIFHMDMSRLEPTTSAA